MMGTSIVLFLKLMFLNLCPHCTIKYHYPLFKSLFQVCPKSIHIYMRSIREIGICITEVVLVAG